ncbi:recQ-mediated genome instability protein 1-like [Bidens hawaiensis]|uniref:recQ-mediated genome instability protein 1-like n=1 Tax=Bidens hawaiensis TaxID=980011 RepID=UPI00404ACE1C
MSSRRRLLRIVSSSSDEEEEGDDVTHQPPPQQHEPQPLNLQTSNPNSIQIELSDEEEFTDATEHIFNSPPPVVNSSEHYTNSTSQSPIGRVLEELGLRLKREWLDACLRGLETAVPGFVTFDDAKKAKLCFERFLDADMNCCGGGVLPSDVHKMHLVDLPGPFVLQVDEIVNISQPLRERYKKANPGLKRCLKLSMTDGVQRVFGMEYQPIKDLDALAPAGLKVAISNVNVRHGLVMLVPEVIQVLGGSVEELEAARQRLVTEVNKPPRGNRTRTGVIPPLSTRATRAAWPANDIPASNLSPLNNPIPQGATPMQVDNEVPVNSRMSSNSAVSVNAANPINGRVSSDSAVPVNGRMPSNPAVSVHAADTFNARVSSDSAVPINSRMSSNPAVYVNAADPFNGQVSSESAVPINGRVSSSSAVPVNNRVPSSTAVPVNSRVSSSSASPVNSRVPSGSAAPVNSRVPSGSAAPVNSRVPSGSAAPVNSRMPSSFAAPVNRRMPSSSAAPANSQVSSSSAVPVHREHVGQQPPRTEVESSVSIRRMNTEPFSSTAATENSVNVNMENASFISPIIRETVETTPCRVREETTVPVQLASPVAFSNGEDVQMANRSSENPFTYLVNLSVKWAESKDKASHVEGKIKCFVTGVKEFQYKKRNTYELKVYVDDGSLISEILIDHNIVQKKIGYSPAEINTALSSSDPSRVQDMKNIMKQFQDYLVNFEGTMVVRINEASSLPVAIEMEQGCSLSDAWLLLGRLKSSGGDGQRSQMDPIILSP